MDTKNKHRGYLLKKNNFLKLKKNSNTHIHISMKCQPHGRGPYLTFRLLHLVPRDQGVLVRFKPSEATRPRHGYLSTSLKTIVVINISTTTYHTSQKSKKLSPINFYFSMKMLRLAYIYSFSIIYFFNNLISFHSLSLKKT